MDAETAPRERKIRRGIVFLGTLQVVLGAVIIGMSFTAFASTSSDKIRGASPYWAGFVVLFTGSVGFLTWKQLSIVSIGIYTFLSTASVIVSLVATVLTGDSAGFLKTLNYCREVKFEHACECCITNTTCTQSYKFPSIRNCDTVHGFLKDIMFGLCVANIICCVVCLTVTIIGCTLGAQYGRYSQACVFRWTPTSVQSADYDHRYNWSPFPTAPISNLPPWAPPIYSSVPNTPRGVDCPGYQRPPTLFDPSDFPPPYTSREASIAGRHGSQNSLSLEYAMPGHNGISWDRLGPSVFRFFAQDTAGTVSDESFEYIEHPNILRGLGSSTGTSEGVLSQDNMHGRIANAEDGGPCIEMTSQSQQAAVSDLRLPSTSTDSDSDCPHDNVFTSKEGVNHHSRSGTSHGSTRLVRSSEQVRQRRHSWSQHLRATRSIDDAHEEIYYSHIAPNVNPWAPAVVQGHRGRGTWAPAGVQGHRGSTGSPITKQRSNSTPCYATDHGGRARKYRATRSRDRRTRSEDRGTRSENCEIRSGNRRTRSEDRATRSEDRATLSEDRATRSEDRTTRSEDRATRSEDRATRSVDCEIRSEDRETRSEDRATRSEARGRVLSLTSGMNESSQLDEPSSNCSAENHGLFRHFTESKRARKKAQHKKRRRPRNNPGHILERDSYKEVSTSQDGPAAAAAAGTTERAAEYRETTL